MKKVILILLTIIISFTLLSCDKKNELTNIIKPYNLSNEEAKLMSLLGTNNTKVYEYNVDKEVKSIFFHIYMLNKNKEWEEIGKIYGGEAIPLSSRFVISMQDYDEIKIGIEHNNGSSSSTINYNNIIKYKYNLSSISWSESSILVTNKEIPLMLYISTDSENITSFSSNSFYHTDDLIDYEAAIAVTIIFNK